MFSLFSLSAILIILLVILLIVSIKIVPEYQRLVVLRLGRVIPENKGPGLVVVIPLIDQPIRVDLRERVLEIPKQTCITKDNAPISIDFLIYLQVIEPTAAVLNVQNFLVATEGLASTTLRAVVGDINLDEVLSRRDQINQTLRVKLDEVTHRWGVQVNNVEIREIIPPEEVQEAMNKQMAAERNRRAMITEADGYKQSEILRAEGEKQATILKAEAQREAQLLAAEGYAQALSRIYQSAHQIDEKTLSLQYISMLKEVASSPSTKWIIPMELVNAANQILKR